MAAVLIVAGAALVVVCVALYSPQLAVGVAGVFLFAAGVDLTRPDSRLPGADR